MTTTDWIIDIALIFIVIRQIREARIDLMFFLVPIGLVSFTASKYLHGLPTGGNDLTLVGLLTGLGVLLGVAGGLTTHVRRDAEGKAFVRAGWAAASIWVASMTARLGFIIWITHSGQDELARFSMNHDITSGQAWTTALILLALSEVVVRMAIILTRALRSVPAPAAELVAA